MHAGRARHNSTTALFRHEAWRCLIQLETMQVRAILALRRNQTTTRSTAREFRDEVIVLMLIICGRLCYRQDLDYNSTAINNLHRLVLIVQTKKSKSCER